MRATLKAIWSFVTGLFVLAVLGAFVLLILFQIARRGGEVAYPYTLVSIVAVLSLVGLVWVAVSKGSWRLSRAWKEFCALDLHDRVQTMTSVATTLVVIFGVIFAASSYDKARFAAQLSENDLSHEVWLQLRAAEDFGIRTQHEAGEEFASSERQVTLNGSDFISELVSSGEWAAYEKALQDAEDCLARRECNPSWTRRNICNATENLGELLTILPEDRWKDDEDAGRFRKTVDWASRAVVQHCTFPQALDFMVRHGFY